MTSKNTKVIAAVNEHSEKMQVTGLELRMRTECRSDSQRIQGLLLPWIFSWKESSGNRTDDSHIDDDGIVWASQTWGSDTEVQFTLKKNGPNLQEVRWLIDKLVDCHVASESLDIADHYTGQRLSFRVYESQMSAPSRGIIGTAMRALNQQREYFETFVQLAVEGLNALSEAEHRQCIGDNRSVTSQASRS
jgi:hypothetical protein